jgi:serine/threonine-protein kinase
MGLRQKILLFTGLLVVALLATTLTFTAIQADRLAHETIGRGLSETRGVWETFQADRYNKLRLGIRVLGNDPYFKAAIETADAPTILDTLKERNLDLKADFFLATDPAGVVLARTDRPGARGEDLSADPLVAKPLDAQEESATIWRQGDKLYHAVSVPMQTGPDLKGVLVAGYGLNEALAGDIRKLTHSEVAFLSHVKGQPPRLAASSLGPREATLAGLLSRPELAAGGSAEMAPLDLDLGGERHLCVQVPLKSAGGEVVGSLLALRSLPAEMASFSRFRSTLILVSLLVMVVGLGLAWLAAARITGPVRRLVDLVERARDGSYSGAVSLTARDEIGTLARAFNSLLTDLREKEQMIGFLRDGMTQLRKGGAILPAAASAETVALQGTVASHLLAGRYQVLGVLGQGGMGVVYQARDTQLDEVVALKLLRPEVLRQDPTLLERFKQEIKLARKVTHRNVLRTHDFGEADGTPYISMEYLEGVTLKDLILGKGALPEGVGLRICKQMCQGLDAAHRMGVVHRDVKPQNMLILPETGELKIMDFGIAHVSRVEGDSASGLTTAGTVMGTPDYMPPEQAQGHPADFRSDIYSLGVVFYEVFTGRLPFHGDTSMATVLAHIQQPVSPPRNLSPDLPEGIQAVILRCLEKDPARRYQSVAEILKELAELPSRLEPALAG